MVTFPTMLVLLGLLFLIGGFRVLVVREKPKQDGVIPILFGVVLLLIALQFFAGPQWQIF